MSLPKHRNLLILAVLAIPLVLNMFALWQAIGLETLGQAANGKYQPFGVPFNPFSDILRTASVILISLGVFAWVVLFIWNKVASQQDAVKRLTALLAAIIIAGATATSSYFIDGTWSAAFRDSPMIGFPISPLAFINMFLAFAAVVLFVFFALSWAAKDKQRTTGAKTS